MALLALRVVRKVRGGGVFVDSSFQGCGNLGFGAESFAN